MLSEGDSTSRLNFLLLMESDVLRAVYANAASMWDCFCSSQSHDQLESSLATLVTVHHYKLFFLANFCL